jgi:bifunctional DNA-binding transcriptional regulator/antitoxin component of YhaV-PrlF toxin-antitoxin module
MASSDKKTELSFTVYVRCEGRVTIPNELRDAYAIKEGDLVVCEIRKIK